MNLGKLLLISLMLVGILFMSGCTQTNSVDKYYCESDSDCVHLPSKCHQGSHECVSKDYASTIKLPDEPVVCTEECRPCTECYCEDNICKTRALEPPGCC